MQLSSADSDQLSDCARTAVPVRAQSRDQRSIGAALSSAAQSARRPVTAGVRDVLPPPSDDGRTALPFRCSLFTHLLARVTDCPITHHMCINLLSRAQHVMKYNLRQRHHVDYLLSETSASYHALKNRNALILDTED